MRVARRFTALSLPLLLALAACGSPAEEPAADQSSSTGEFPVTVADARGDVTIEEKPTRIISLSPSLTEILFEVGAGDQVVAVDEYSNYPPEAPTTDLSGFTPNVEAIADYEPDLVVLSEDGGDITEQLEKLPSRSCCCPPPRNWTTPSPRWNCWAKPPATPTKASPQPKNCGNAWTPSSRRSSTTAQPG